MGRPRVEIDMELLRQLRRARAELGWRRLSRLYYRYTKQDISWMTLRKRYLEAELPINSLGKQAHNELQ